MQTPVDEAVRFKLDFRAWLRTLTPRERYIIRAMSIHERTKDLSRQFRLSEGRTSQIHNQFKDGWKRFCDGDDSLNRRWRGRRRKVRA